MTTGKRCPGLKTVENALEIDAAFLLHLKLQKRKHPENAVLG